jgi:hypothetical protein
MLLGRLKTRYPLASGTSGERLFVAAFMIASKLLSDETYSSRSWRIVARNMFTLEEIHKMEREMCGYLDWNLVRCSRLIQFVAKFIDYVSR